MELTNTDLQSYINEINENSPGEISSLSPEEIALEHLKEQTELENLTLEPNYIEDPELKSDDYQIFSNIPRPHTTPALKKAALKQLERETIKEALTQTYLDLNSIISLSDKKRLIAFLVSGYAIAKNRQKAFIDNTFQKCFTKFVPKDILRVWTKYPNLFIPFPGFTYKCSKELGNGNSYWVDLNLPLYFSPETCETFFKSQYPEKIRAVEQSIYRYYCNRQIKIDNEVKHAKALTSISTYIQLLKKKPYWYYLLISYLKKKNKWE